MAEAICSPTGKFQQTLHILVTSAARLGRLAAFCGPAKNLLRKKVLPRSSIALGRGGLIHKTFNDIRNSLEKRLLVEKNAALFTRLYSSSRPIGTNEGTCSEFRVSLVTFLCCQATDGAKKEDITKETVKLIRHPECFVRNLSTITLP
jgi:hypothetical protein